MMKGFFVLVLLVICQCLLTNGFVLSSQNIFKQKNLLKEKQTISHLTSKQPASPLSLAQATQSSLEPAPKRTSFFSKYEHMLQTYPYSTKLITALIIGALGDVLTQLLFAYKAKQFLGFDLRRILVFSAVSALYFAPVLHVWFNYLNEITKKQTSPVRKALTMMLLDQTFGAVFVNMIFFFVFELVKHILLFLFNLF